MPLVVARSVCFVELFQPLPPAGPNLAAGAMIGRVFVALFLEAQGKVDSSSAAMAARPAFAVERVFQVLILSDASWTCSVRRALSGPGDRDGPHMRNLPIGFCDSQPGIIQFPICSRPK
jgi:hypothetical protein